MKPPFWRRIPGNCAYLLRIIARRPEEDVDAELRFHFDERIVDVEQRRQELGVRIAFGAESTDVVGLVVGQAMRFALAGVVIGSTVALGAGRWMHPLLFEESPGDPLVYAIVTAALVAVAIAASAFPVFRAAGTDPNLVLRSE